MSSLLRCSSWCTTFLSADTSASESHIIENMTTDSLSPGPKIQGKKPLTVAGVITQLSWKPCRKMGAIALERILQCPRLSVKDGTFPLKVTEF